MFDGPEPGDVDGVEFVRDALTSIDDPPAIDAGRARDADYLTDLLLDRARNFDGMRFLYLLTALQANRIDELARDLCQREYLLLDPSDLSEETIVKIFMRQASGRRMKPFKLWVRSVLRDVVMAATVDPEQATFPEDLAVHGSPQFLAALAHLSNTLQVEVRRLVWMAWVERQDVHQMSRSTGIPVERAEWLLATVLEKAGRLALTQEHHGESVDEEEPRDQPFPDDEP